MHVLEHVFEIELNTTTSCNSNNFKKEARNTSFLQVQTKQKQKNHSPKKKPRFNDPDPHNINNNKNNKITLKKINKKIVCFVSLFCGRKTKKRRGR